MTAASRGITLWNSENWQRVTNFPGQLAVFAKSGELLITSESSPFFWEPAGKIVLWNCRTGEKLKELSQPGRTMALSPDDRTLAVAGVTRDIDLWEVPSGKWMRKLSTEMFFLVKNKSSGREDA